MHNKTKTAAISLTSILFLAILITPSVHADESAIDVITIDVPSSCSMSATGMDSHTANVNNGQTTSDIGTTNLKVICNDNSGYAIYAIGYTDDTYGKTVLTSYALGSTQDIITSSTVTTGTSSWAMKLAAVSGTYAPTIVTNYASYYAVPQTYTKVAYYASSTDTGNNATGSNLTTTYRAYISPTQPAGTYVGQVKYTLIHPNSDGTPAIYTISFNANGGGDTITGVPEQQEGLGVGSYTVTIPDTTPVREGYRFSGWSLSSSATTADYRPGDTFTTTTTTPTLYAVWKEPYIWLATYDECGDTFIDNRDGVEREYTTGLINGECWMTTNLMLGKSTDTALTSATSNVSSSGFTLPGYSSAKGTRGGGGDIPDDPGVSDTVLYSGSTDCSSAGGCYNYYNFNVACAGSSNCQYDICPANWNLPSSAYFEDLASTYTTSAAIMASPFLGVLSGLDGPTSIGIEGAYWSKTIYDSRNSYILTFGTANYQSADHVAVIYQFKDYLLAVRCVLKLPK